MRVLRCPECSSTEVFFEAGGFTGQYRCKRCGYLGGFVIEEDVETP